MECYPNSVTQNLMEYVFKEWKYMNALTVNEQFNQFQEIYILGEHMNIHCKYLSKND